MAVVARTVSDNGLSAGGLWCSDVLADLPTDLTVEVVIGNLYADLVDRLLVDQRLDSLLPQGPLILSGIAEDRVGAIEKLLAECGWQLGARDQEGWWHGLVAVR